MECFSRSQRKAFSVMKPAIAWAVSYKYIIFTDHAMMVCYKTEGSRMKRRPCAVVTFPSMSD